MRRVILLVFTLLIAVSTYAQTPAEKFLESFCEVKGAKKTEARGAMMIFARPVLKKFPIAPMANDVEEVTVLNLGKASELDKERFVSEMTKMLEDNGYIYNGKFDSPNGPVDVYAHLKTDTLVDELVVFNPDLYALNILLGNFSVEKLLKL